MKDITNDFLKFYYPKSALVFYQKKGNHGNSYVEFFDMDRNGNPVNAHPLSLNEAKRLARALNVDDYDDKRFLVPKSIMKKEILHIDHRTSRVMWFTKAQQRNLYFIKSFDISNGLASVPPMLWLASRESVMVYALATDRKPTGNTKLYHAPFFNIHENGVVCMGTVDIDMKNIRCLEEFTSAWEDYFFNSNFSHLMSGFNPVNGNCVLLWTDLIGTGKPFLMDALKANGRTVKNFI